MAPLEKTNRSVSVSRYCGLLLCLLLSPAAGFGDAATVGQPPKHNAGWSYRHEEVPEIPWSIHVLKVERGRNDLEFHTTSGQSNTLGMSPVSQQIKNLPPGLGVPVAAINGDFYNNHEDYPGDPRDLQIRRGELVSAPANHVCFWIDSGGNPQMTNVLSRFRVIWPDHSTTPFGLNEERRDDGAVLYTSAAGLSTHTSGGVELVLEGMTNSPWLPLHASQIYRTRVHEIKNQGDTSLKPDVLVLSFGPDLAKRLPKVSAGTVLEIATSTTPDLTGVTTAIGGGPTLVRNGKAMQWSGFQLRHPRTAMGWNKDHLFMVEVDGRQSSLSVGMTLPELAAYMIKLGCEQAMNLDGGGSATLWVCGNVMNSPSEGQERPGANALVLIQKKTEPKASQ